MDGGSKDKEQKPQQDKLQKKEVEPEEDTPRGLTGQPAPSVNNKPRFRTPEEDLPPLPVHKEEQ